MINYFYGNQNKNKEDNPYQSNPLRNRVETRGAKIWPDFQKKLA